MREADPRSGPLHPATWEALEEVRAAGEKAIVMVNRRGFAPWLTCRSCGHHWGCPNCDVSLIVHRDSRPPRLPPLRPLRAAARAPARECGSTTLSQAGAGTEQVEALLAEPPRRRCRSSGSTPTPPPGAAPTPASSPPSARPRARVLVGTQMVAKGHDFPEVTLSAILDADATLRFPDFRADERTFAMVAQLAGRSGRGEAGGEVIVQTLAPSAPSIAHAARHDAAGFLAERDRAPPGAALPALLAPGPDRARAESEARLDARRDGAGRGASPRRCPTETDLLGPAPMFRVRSRHRRRLLIKADDREGTVAAVRDAVEGLAADRAPARGRDRRRRRPPVGVRAAIHRLRLR